MTLCFSCGIYVKYRKITVTHTNIAQNPPVKVFCSKACKIKWCLRKQKKNSKINKYSLDKEKGWSEYY